LAEPWATNAAGRAGSERPELFPPRLLVDRDLRHGGDSCDLLAALIHDCDADLLAGAHRGSQIAWHELDVDAPFLTARNERFRVGEDTVVYETAAGLRARVRAARAAGARWIGLFSLGREPARFWDGFETARGK